MSDPKNAAAGIAVLSLLVYSLVIVALGFGAATESWQPYAFLAGGFAVAAATYFIALRILKP